LLLRLSAFSSEPFWSATLFDGNEVFSFDFCGSAASSRLISVMTTEKVIQTPMKLTITADSEKLIQLCDLLSFARKRAKAIFNLPDVPLKLIRLDVSHRSAGRTGKTVVRIYPTDSFLNFAAAFLAGQFDLYFIQNTGHDYPTKKNIFRNTKIS
jgi:hypothetical protein